VTKTQGTILFILKNTAVRGCVYQEFSAYKRLGICALQFLRFLLPLSDSYKNSVQKTIDLSQQ